MGYYKSVDDTVIDMTLHNLIIIIVYSLESKTELLYRGKRVGEEALCEGKFVQRGLELHLHFQLSGR